MSYYYFYLPNNTYAFDTPCAFPNERAARSWVREWLKVNRLPRGTKFHKILEKMSYNGWTNWETWQILLWIDNEEYSHKEMRRFLRRQRHSQSLTKLIEEFVRELYPDGTPDMDSAAEYDAVNWDEITHHLVEEHDNEQ